MIYDIIVRAWNVRDNALPLNEKKLSKTSVVLFFTANTTFSVDA